ncbi:hypothetical protein E4H12_01880 [Candidatus Thorarchaeota archaeon]|nr:MAG: hypothetical protein E4H12_01880 [Candidatus Thorarchaeota archaeon]
MKWLLALLLFDPTTSVEEMRYVVVETQQQCEHMKEHALNLVYSERTQRPNRKIVKDAECREVDLSRFSLIK